MEFNDLLKKDFIILDGALGTMLQSSGMKLGEIPEELSITNPELLIDIHRQYVEAGSDIIYSSTFGANAYKLKDSKYSVEELIKAGVKNAKAACEGTDTLVALSLGPIGRLIEPSGDMSFEEAYEMYKQEVVAGSEADIIVFETQTDLYEVKAAVLAAKENTNKPIIVTMSFEENGHTFTGCSAQAMALTLSGLGVDAIGVNCSLGPDELMPIVEEISKWTSLPLVIKPNAGLPDPITGKYNVFPKDFSQSIGNMARLGIRFAGGCCGTTPEYIKAVKAILASKEPTINNNQIEAAVCTPTKTVVINQPRIIGERINPTGKKRFKQALIENDIDYIIGQAIQQTDGGAELLDVNVGLPDIDEKAMMIKTVKALQGVVDLPLQIDSTKPEVIEAALRVYNGKAIVNSVNGEDEVLDNILPIVKKYGAAVVGLTLDKNGIPKKAEQRFALAEKILNRAIEYGIPKENVFIDCLTLTASAEQAAVMETIKAVNMVKTKLALKTVLGVSNISFGLPNRNLITSTFLTMALDNGLDLPIINPNIEVMTGAVRAFRLLKNIDVNSIDFIAAYSEAPQAQQVQTAGGDYTLDEAIEKGMKSEARDITKKLLESVSPMDIINNVIIPALDKAGGLFEKGKIFLPQLLMSAGTAQEAFEIIKTKLAGSGESSGNKGTIVIATVKGDVHDIGKNIVKVLLENYGYNVIDLGKDVEYQAVVDAVKEHNCRLVGLSALMTTTLPSMADTIALLRENKLDCRVMVGGAVLTPEYAKKIGADFYSKDAKQSVDIAKQVLG